MTTAIEQPPTDVSESTNPGIATLIRGSIRVSFVAPNEMTRWRVTSFSSKEPDTVAWLDSLEPGSVLFDVGANVGMYALYAAARGLRVYAFEPESQNFAILNANIALNGLQDRITAYPICLSDTLKIDRLYLSDFTAGGSCHSFGAEVGFDLKPRKSAFPQGSISVSIDQLVSQMGLPSPHYVKIDVDGFEHKVIAGASQTLGGGKSSVRSVLVELNTHLSEHQQVISRLEALGLTHDPQQASRALRKAGPFQGVGEFIFTRQTDEKRKLSEELILKPPTGKRARQIMHHVLDRVMSTPITVEPFPYLVVDEVFPEDYYQEMLDNFPLEVEGLRPLSETGRVTANSYQERLCLLFTDEDFARLPSNKAKFWRELASWLYSEPFMSGFIQKFWHALEPRLDRILREEQGLHVKGDALLVEDHTRYSIGPHTDAPHRLITFLFYLPVDDRYKDLGTSIYRPKDSSFVCWGGPHHPREHFEKVATIEFLPNRLLAFPKTERSFHGVEPIQQPDVARRLLINNVRVMGRVTH
jgi:FkbM family methyltransferase